MVQCMVHGGICTCTCTSAILLLVYILSLSNGKHTDQRSTATPQQTELYTHAQTMPYALHIVYNTPTCTDPDIDFKLLSLILKGW